MGLISEKVAFPFWSGLGKLRKDRSRDRMEPAWCGMWYVFKSAMPTDTFLEVSGRQLNLSLEFSGNTFECLWTLTAFKVQWQLGSECRKKEGG